MYLILVHLEQCCSRSVISLRELLSILNVLISNQYTPMSALIYQFHLQHTVAYCQSVCFFPHLSLAHIVLFSGKSLCIPSVSRGSLGLLHVEDVVERAFIGGRRETTASLSTVWMIHLGHLQLHFFLPRCLPLRGP
jgi:hypothetical protein